MSELLSPLGLVAGNGTFPLEFAKNACSRAIKVAAVLHRNETDPSIEQYLSASVWLKVGQLGKIIKFFKRAGVQQVAFAGGISRPRLFGGVKLDWTAVRMLARLKSFRDDALLRGIAGELEKNGIEVIAASCLLEQSVARSGLLTSRDLVSEELRDAGIGWEAAKALGALDIGQTAVVADGLVVALEAIEGTDATIKRAGWIFDTNKRRGPKQGVVVKVCKPSQDLRLDLPAVGVNTIAHMEQAGLSALVLEADKSILLDPDAVVRAANKAKIAIRVVTDIGELKHADFARTA